MKCHSCFLFLFFTLMFFSCKDKPVFQKIEFQHPYLFNSEIEEKAKVLGKYQMVATHYSLKGNHKKALEVWNLAFPPRIKNFLKKETDSIKSIYKTVPAIENIVEKAKSNQIVILNEAHHNASHRVFARSLLKKLYENGYTFMGAEALTNSGNITAPLNERNYPIRETGYYVKEPKFGNLIRTALEIGYQVFPYEHIAKDKNPHSGPNPREIGQAKNIKALIEKNPDAKFFIFCGYDHAVEGEHHTWEKAMAGRLKEYTGIDPLTINQVAYSQKSQPKYNPPLLKIFEAKKPFILMDSQNKPYRNQSNNGKGWMDIAVFQPKTTYSNGRPSWLFTGGVKPVEIDLSDLKLDFPVMVLAYKKAENIQEAIPVDIIEVENRDDYSFLGLKEGDYTIVITNIKGNAFKFEKEV